MSLDRDQGQGSNKDKGLDQDKGSEKDKDKDKGLENLDGHMTKEAPTPTATADVTDTTTTTTAITTTNTTATAVNTITDTATAVTTATEPMPSDQVKESYKDKGLDNDKKDVLLAPLDASLSSVDLMLLATVRKNSRNDSRGQGLSSGPGSGLGSGNLYLSSSSEFERCLDGAISEGFRSVGDSYEMESALNAPPVKSSCQITSPSQSNLIGDELNVEPYLFDPVVQQLWSRLCQVREEMARYEQQ